MHAIRTVWGDDALNPPKQVEEGTPGPTQIVWGLHMDMRAMTCRLPEPKALKPSQSYSMDPERSD